jgi:hypothetical protein
VVKKDSKFEVIKTVTTVNGTLYKGEKVRFQRKEDGHKRVKDSMGRRGLVDDKNLKRDITNGNDK